MKYNLGMFIDKTSPIFNLLRPAVKIGFTCGAFDLLHAGHALMLEECKKHCDWLVVGVQSDPSIDRSEKNKPVQSYEERQIMVKSIKWVDEVVTYDTEKDLVDLLQEMKNNNIIDVRIIGADWQGKRFTGDHLPIPVIFNKRDHGYSTSELRQRVAAVEYLKKENKLKIVK
jgi:glycerol-3-phosphate cytidylyltransferase